MVGKTPSEAARMMSQFVTTTRDTYSPPPPPRNDSPALDPNLMYSDPAAYQQQLLSTLNASFQQATAPLYQQNAQTALSLAKRGRYADVWKRFEPEILGELHGISPAAYNESLLDKAAEIVQGRHWRDFVNEAASALVANGGVGTERGTQPGGDAAPSVGDALDEAWESDNPYFVRAREQKLSKTQMRDFITRNLKQSVKDFVMNVTQEEVIPTARGFERRAS